MTKDMLKDDDQVAVLPHSVDEIATPAPTELAAADEEDDALVALNIEEALRQAVRGDNSHTSREVKPLITFADAKLVPSIHTAIAQLGWHEPTGVQALCLPHTLAGTDVAGFAQTGTGKTAVFLITIAQRVLELKEKGATVPSPAAVVLAPTRELAIQIEEEARALYQHLGIETLAIYGGMNWESQAQAVKQGVDVIVATPGRMKDYEEKRFFSLKDTVIFVCDEVDRMFDMGFIEDVEYFVAKLKPDCQKLLFSATTNERVKELAFEYLNQPEYISVHPEELTPERIDQHALLCETPHKFKVLLGLLQEHQPGRAIIFCNTKLTAAWLHYKLTGNGIGADLITGDLPQAKRIRLIKRIKSGDVKILIATDVASRGLHISDVTHVYNFDIPDDAANYVHRIGRTARAGARGAAYTLICEEYASNFLAVQELLGKDAPKTSWHATSYLEVADKSGNPFADDFGRGPVGGAEQGERYERYERGGFDRGSDRSYDRNGGARRDGRGGPRRDGRGGERGRGPDRDRGQQSAAGGRHGERGRGPQHHGRDRDRNRDRDQQHRRKRGGQSAPAAAAAAAAPAPTRSFGGMLRRIAGLLFGWFKRS